MRGPPVSGHAFNAYADDEYPENADGYA